MRYFLSAAAVAALLAGSALANPARHPAPKETSPDTAEAEETPVDQLEVTLEGTRFTSRDALEGALLLKAARTALAHKRDWFVLHHLPGERPNQHPARSGAAFGEQYGHWQPHWNYFLAAEGWQPWHPEWGAHFWADDVDPRSVSRFVVHAMIGLGSGPLPKDERAAFDARAVVAHLGHSPAGDAD